MPFYSYHCKRCDKVQDAYRHVSQRHDSPACCDEAMAICIVAPAVQPDVPGYESPVSGKWIEGKSARREDLRRSNCRPYEAGERDDARRSHVQEMKQQEAQTFESAARAYYSLSPDKRRMVRGAM
jgi:hypothetical protein